MINNNFSDELLKTYITNSRTSFIQINKHYQESILDIDLIDLTQSIIHMTINRHFKSNQRLYELVIYDVLYKVTKTEKIKETSN